MRRQSAIIALLIATTIQAGCVAIPTDSESMDATSEPSQPTPSQEPISAKEPERGAGEPSDPEPVSARPAPPAMTSIGVAFQGRTPARYCREPSPPSGCVTFKPGENTSVALGAFVHPAFLKGTLTWKASGYSTGHLVAHLMVHNGKEYVYPNGWWGRAHGESPLNVSFNLARYGGQKLALAIGNDECMMDTAPALNCAFAGSYTVELAQGFSFKGDLTGRE